MSEPTQPCDPTTAQPAGRSAEAPADIPEPDPGNTDPGELTEDIDPDDDVLDRISAIDLGPAEQDTADDSDSGAARR